MEQTPGSGSFIGMISYKSWLHLRFRNPISKLTNVISWQKENGNLKLGNIAIITFFSNYVAFLVCVGSPQV